MASNNLLEVLPHPQEPASSYFYFYSGLCLEKTIFTVAPSFIFMTKPSWRSNLCLCVKLHWPSFFKARLCGYIQFTQVIEALVVPTTAQLFIHVTLSKSSNWLDGMNTLICLLRFNHIRSVQ